MLGTTDFRSNGFNARFPCNRVAVDPRTNEIALISFIGPATTIQAVAAAMLELSIWADFNFENMSFEGGYCVRARKSKSGYVRRRFALGYGTWQCVMATKDTEFLPDITDDALFIALTGARYTTPLVADWIPFVRGVLEDAGGLQPCLSFGCKAGVLTVSDTTMDEVVSGGLKKGRLLI